MDTNAPSGGPSLAEIETGELQFDYKARRKGGGGVLRAVLAGQPVFTSKADAADPAARSAFLDTVCAKRPGIDRAAAEQALEDVAAGCVDDEPGDGERRSQADVLVELAADAELFRDGETAYATVPAPAAGQDGGAIDGGAAGHRENHAVHAKGFRQWLARRFWDARRKAAGSQAVQDALNVLSARAAFEGPARPVAVRLAGHDGAVYLDLCNDRWEAVRVTAGGWDVVADPPVRFVRRRGMLPLLTPVRGGRLADLRPLINAADEDHWRLMGGWLVGALRPSGPYPVLALNGEQGSGKSTTSRMLRRLVDPNEADLRSAPRDERDLMIAATNAHVVAFDNLSHVRPELSDALCRLATGGGFATRELYTDADEKLFHATRPILFNGIEELATRPDLLERAIVVNLPAISPAGRRTERDLWAAYEAARPGILGGLLDAVAAALRNLPGVRLDRRPRMADFAEWAVAAEPALPWPAGGFLAAYRRNADAANDLALEASAVGPALLGLMSVTDTWEGTAKELQAELESDRHSDHKTRNRRDWPRTPKGFANALRRLAPTLRRAGVEATLGDREPTKERRRLVRLERMGEESSESAAPSGDVVPTSPTGMGSDDAGRSVDGGYPADRPPRNGRGGAAGALADGADASDGHNPALSYAAAANGDGRERGRL